MDIDMGRALEALKAFSAGAVEVAPGVWTTPENAARKCAIDRAPIMRARVTVSLYGYKWTGPAAGEGVQGLMGNAVDSFLSVPHGPCVFGEACDGLQLIETTPPGARTCRYFDFIAFQDIGGRDVEIGRGRAVIHGARR